MEKTIIPYAPKAPWKHMLQDEPQEVLPRQGSVFCLTTAAVDISERNEAILDKIAQGSVTLSQGTDDLVLQLPESVVLEVQVEDEEKKTKGIQHSLEIEIKWFDNEQGGSLELK